MTRKSAYTQRSIRSREVVGLLCVQRRRKKNEASMRSCQTIADRIYDDLGLPNRGGVMKQQLELIRSIQDALGTAETGDALVEVARNAHRAEQQFAWLTKKLENIVEEWKEEQQNETIEKGNTETTPRSNDVQFPVIWNHWAGPTSRRNRP